MERANYDGNQFHGFPCQFWWFERDEYSINPDYEQENVTNPIEIKKVDQDQDAYDYTQSIDWTSGKIS